MRPVRLLGPLAVLCALFLLIGSPLIVPAAGPSGAGGGYGGGGVFHGGGVGGGFHGSVGGNGSNGAFGGGSFRPQAPQPSEPRRLPPPRPHPHPGPPPGPHPGPTPLPYYHGWVFYDGGWVPYYGDGGGQMATALAVGTFVEALAADVQTLVIGDQTFYFDGTNYFEDCLQGIDSGYCVVPAPHDDNE